MNTVSANKKLYGANLVILYCKECKVCNNPFETPHQDAQLCQVCAMQKEFMLEITAFDNLENDEEEETEEWEEDNDFALVLPKAIQHLTTQTR